MAVGSPPAADTASPPSFRPLQAIVALGGIQALTMLAGLARTKVLAVLLGPAGVGVASVVDQVVSLVAQLGAKSSDPSASALTAISFLECGRLMR